MARLDWVRRLQAVAQNGLHYASSPFDVERFEEVRAVAAELAADAWDEPVDAVAARFSAESGHACPKLDVRAAAFRDGRVLLVRGVDDGLWTLPGGWAEVGESPSAAVEKELWEESGHRGRAVRVIGVYDRDARARERFPFHGWKLQFLCELDDGDPEPPQASEVTEVAFFAADSLPRLSERTPARMIEDAFAHERDPSLPAVFD